MGLFDRLSNRAGKDMTGKGGSGNLGEYSGMRVEVVSEGETPLFVARVSVSWDGRMELTPISGLSSGINELVSIPVSLRGYQESVRKAVHMDCNIERRSNGVWEVRNLEITGKDNDRSFFRQDTSIVGEVVQVGRGGINSQSCEVVNISAGGVCIRVAAAYAMGDKLMLNSKLLPNWDLAPLMCVVRRITRRRGVIYEYGCEFLNLNPATEDMIAKAIIEMQMKNRKR